MYSSRNDPTDIRGRQYQQAINRFEVIEEETINTPGVTTRTVNAELLRYSNGVYSKTGRKVFIRTLDYPSFPLIVGQQVFAVWMADTSAWEVVSGGGGEDTYKRLVRFTIDADLTTADSSAEATIRNQYGPWTDHDTATPITVNNMLTSLVGTYLFYGLSGAAGLAMWDSERNFIIIQMECAK